jgi:predicted restriction endonuclease
MRLPFGRLHGRNPEIIELAAQIGRSPGALAMKACNFAALDPTFLATNRRGLSGASRSDRALWEEFSNNPEKLAVETEAKFAEIDPTRALSDLDAIRPPTGETDKLQIIRARRVQSFFRAAVLTSYGSRCAISGLATTELLIASHIIPWSKSIERRADPRNGICLSALFDRAFDKGLITLDEDYRVVVSKRLLKDAKTASLSNSIDKAHGRQIEMPRRFIPDTATLDHHRMHTFVDSRKDL